DLAASLDVHRPPQGEHLGLHPGQLVAAGVLERERLRQGQDLAVEPIEVLALGVLDPEVLAEGEELPAELEGRPSGDSHRGVESIRKWKGRRLPAPFRPSALDGYQRYQRPPLEPLRKKPSTQRISAMMRTIQRKLSAVETNPPPPRSRSSRTKTIRATSIRHYLPLICSTEETNQGA